MASLFGFPLTINFLELLKLIWPLMLIVLFHPMYRGTKARFLQELRQLEIEKIEFHVAVVAAKKRSRKGRKPAVRLWMEDVDNFIEKDVMAFQNSWAYGVPLLCDIACWWVDLVNQARELKARRRLIEAPLVGSTSLTLPFLDPRKMTIPIVGGEETLAAIRRHLEDDQVRVIGIHGMAGIGKTTYLKVIAYKQWEFIEERRRSINASREAGGRQAAAASSTSQSNAGDGGRQAASVSSASQSNAVDRETHGGGSQPDDGQGDAVVLWADISEAEEPNIVIDLQRLIGKELGLSLPPAVAGSEARALVIWEELKEKQFILFVDGVQRDIISGWEAVGVPLPQPKSKCKIVFTTRSSEVCEALANKGHKAVKVNPLTEVESRILFLKTIGETRSIDDGIRSVAMAVADRCGGLPRALKAVAEDAMFFTNSYDWQTISEWWNAPVIPIRASGMHNLESFLKRMETYLTQLPEPEYRCLLYCSLFPEDQPIHGARLVDYWIGEGFLREWTWEYVRKEGEAVISRLRQKDVIMSSSGDDEGEIRLHDVVRRMAMWMTGRGRNEHHIYLTSAAMSRLAAVGEARIHPMAWDKVERISYIGSESDTRAEMRSCSKLLTLLLNADCGSASLQEINHSRPRSFPWDVDLRNFFPPPSELRVLDLSGAQFSGGRFPEGIDSLAELSYLNLSYTNIEQLPGGLEKLQKLRQLILRGTSSLSLSQVISLKSISKCSLQVLDLLSSGANSSSVEVSCLQEFEELSVLGISVTCSTYLDELLYHNELFASTAFLQLCRVEGLTDLHLSQVSSTYLDKLLASPELSASTAFLQLCRVEGLTDSLLSQVFEKMENLRELSVEMTAESTVEVIIHGGQLPKLETLSLAFVNIRLDPENPPGSGGHLLESLRRLHIVHGGDHGYLSLVQLLSPDRVQISID